jgi:acetyl esterase/lipase
MDNPEWRLGLVSRARARKRRRGRAPAALLAALATVVIAVPAEANVPDPITKTDPVRISETGTANGSLTTEVTYGETTAAATTSTGDTISLAGGSTFRLRTCVAYHLHGSPPVSHCAERTVDTRANTAPITTSAPSVTLPAQPRPTTEPWGYFTPYTEVLSLTPAPAKVIAHSWPGDGLRGAGIAVAAQEQIAGTLPPNSPVSLDGPFTSAIDTGQADSICTPTPAAPDDSPLPAGVSRSHPAFLDAPSSYEVGLPTGAHAGQARRGVMLVIHGGAWTLTGAGAVKVMRPDADRWRARGWETVNLTYRACGHSRDDVLWFYDQARTWYGANATICTLGESAGGHLALQVGAERPDLYCAVSMAGPTDLTRIQDEHVYDPATGEHDSTLGGRWVHNLAAAAFGEENLPRYSPAANADASLRSTRVLQGFSAHDTAVPYQQGADLADSMRAANPDAYVDTLQLAAGTIRFVHAPVTQAALDEFHAHEEQLVAPVGAPTASPPLPGRR